MNCGYVALIGCPNVGKSTLINYLLGQKISITSRKPQTTRHQILGIKTSNHGQIIFVDTPGMHDGGKRALNSYLNQIANASLASADLVILLLDGLQWHRHDDVIVKKLEQANLPVILAINKIDKIKDKATLLPFLANARQRFAFKNIIPISALKGSNLEQLEQLVLSYLPKSKLIYPESQVTDRSERFLVAEIIREKLIKRLGQELPYALAVEIECYQETKTITKIYAIVWVERNTQKNIVIGKRGIMLKNIGIDARKDIENLIDNKAYLRLWVKVKQGWGNNEKSLRGLGFYG